MTTNLSGSLTEFSLAEVLSLLGEFYRQWGQYNTELDKLGHTRKRTGS